MEVMYSPSVPAAMMYLPDCKNALCQCRFNSRGRRNFDLYYLTPNKVKAVDWHPDQITPMLREMKIRRNVVQVCASLRVNLPKFKLTPFIRVKDALTWVILLTDDLSPRGRLRQCMLHLSDSRWAEILLLQWLHYFFPKITFQSCLSTSTILRVFVFAFQLKHSLLLASPMPRK